MPLFIKPIDAVVAPLNSLNANGVFYDGKEMNESDFNQLPIVCAVTETGDRAAIDFWGMFFLHTILTGVWSIGAYSNLLCRSHLDIGPIARQRDVLQKEYNVINTKLTRTIEVLPPTGSEIRQYVDSFDERAKFIRDSDNRLKTIRAQYKILDKSIKTLLDLRDCLSVLFLAK